MARENRICGTWRFNPVGLPGTLYLNQLWLYSATVLYPMRAVKHIGLFPRTSIGKYPPLAQTPGQGPLYSGRHQAPVDRDPIEAPRESIINFEHGMNVDKYLMAAFTRPVVDEAMKLISRLLPKAARILVVGGGSMTELFRLAALVPEGEVIGVDPAAEVIARASEEAQWSGYRNTAFLQADVTRLPDEFTGKFDATICSFAFHRYRDPIQALEEMNRVLVQDGKAFVIDADTWWAKLLAAPLAWIGDPGWVGFRSGQEFVDLFNRCGFADFYWEELLPGIGVCVGTK
jgi:SAM-dependent methyltransferase